MVTWARPWRADELADRSGEALVWSAADHEGGTTKALVNAGVVAHQTAEDGGIDVGCRGRIKGGLLLKYRVGGSESTGSGDLSGPEGRRQNRRTVAGGTAVAEVAGRAVAAVTRPQPAQPPDDVSRKSAIGQCES
ncbi:hypothetical protein GCM10022206_78340 [Streptomyces chiangmaiensis]